MDAQATHREAKSAAEARPLRERLGWLVQILCLLFAAYTIVDNVGQFVRDAGLARDAGDLGARFDANFARDGYRLTVVSVAPDGTLSRAGVAVGDRVVFDRRFDSLRKLRAGETVDFTLIRAGRTSHHEVVAQPRKPVRMTSFVQLNLVYEIATGMAALFGAFIIWRSRRHATSLLLGMALVFYGGVSTLPSQWLSEPAVFPFTFALGNAHILVMPILFYAFAMRFYGDCVGPAKTWEKVAFWIYAMVMASQLGLIWLVIFADGFGDVVSRNVFLTLFFMGFAICSAYLIQGWRRSAAGVQQRYALMLIATAAIILAQVFDSASHGNRSEAVQTAHYLANSILTGVIASGLFAYAILRHKVFDLGFAVNRTLVYGVVSAVLLAAFGLIEWAVDHFLPVEGRENNALVDAAIAVGVFLTFHRVRDVVEHVIERVFFRRWQRAEAELRRFVREAAFVTQAPALTQAFARALADFAEGAEAAVYLREGGGYARAVGEVEGAPARLDPDLPALVSLRADPRPVEPQDETLGAFLIAPMVNRNEVIGVVLLGPKPSGLDYRPDEIELIGWATRQVGLDLHALKVERLEASEADLRKTVATLERALSLKSATV